MSKDPTDISTPSWSELDVLVIITVNDATRHQFTSLENLPMEDGIYIAGARSQDIDAPLEDETDKTRVILTMPAVCEVFFAGIESLEEATAICDEIYAIRNALPEDRNSVGHAAELWIAREQDDTNN